VNYVVIGMGLVVGTMCVFAWALCRVVADADRRSDQMMEDVRREKLRRAANGDN